MSLAGPSSNGSPTPQVLEEEHDGDELLKGLMDDDGGSEDNGFLK